MSSSYGKVDEREHVTLEARRKSRKRITIIVVSLLVLVGIVIGAVFGTMANKKSTTVETNDNGDSISVSVKAVCDVTLHKDKCFETVGSAPNASSLNPEQLFIYAVKITIAEATKALNAFSSSGDNTTMHACVELLDLTIDNLENTLTSSQNGDVTLPELVSDLRTWLSSAETYQDTCIETLAESNHPDSKTFGESQLKNATELTSNALAIITWLGKIADSFKLRRRLLSADVAVDFNVGRRLLQSTDLRRVANIVVAKDGSGKYKTISRALKDVPEKSDKRTVIYVKKGVYFENVKVEKTMWNVVVVGDGESKSIVSGKLNVIDGTPTFQSATFAVFGKGFMARDMGFINTAGPSKHQAVALMVSADLAAFYRCTMNAYQDTLYVHAQRQFYRECTIIGTVDFIFGNAASVLQNCKILPRRPMKGQQNTITAQGRKDPNQNTGISIHRCSISPLGNLTGVQTFLGRPWKDFSTTVIMESSLNGFIDPKGWLPWVGDSAPDTIFYGEYKNTGAGASTKNRVKWKGLRFLSTKEANRFTVKPFIDGERWLPTAKVPFRSGL
ncbi:putative pectinesterase/pectinesterase inhibitor 24 [Brassica rapa]|uniref:Pectinesterase n=1 Tax=Brassica campestris TaxID=3711 RepID=M4EZ96_BRACM|nr:putative pectinesterase/pectinesterase inhibitor 24 [Brassica rapa]